MQGWTTPDRTMPHANNRSSRPRWRGQVHALAAAALGACLLLATAATAAVAAEFRNIIANHTPYDFDRDGTSEIEYLEMLFEDEATESTPSVANLVVVLVEERLLTTLPGAEYSVDDLLERLEQLRKDLRAQGYTPRLVITRLYDGTVHQDGKTVLALRELFRATRASYPDFAGAILVGNFPDAMIVRSILWRKSDDRLTIQPEVVARRSDLVLADLDGAWAQIYRQGKQDLVSWNAVSLTPLPTNPAEWPCNGCSIQSRDFLSGPIPFEDFFYIQDGTYSTSVSGQAQPILTVSMQNVAVGPEIAPSDRMLSNAIAQPEIVVSRIDPRRVAVQPDPAFRDLDGKGYLDAAGRPQAVRTPDPVRWVHAAALERQMLIEYFDRNHAYRAGNGNRPLRTAAITYPEKDFKVAPFSSFLQQAADGFAAPIMKGDASVLDFARWLEQPATLKGIYAHANRDITQFGGVYNVAELAQEVGPDIWHWVRQSDRLVPALSDLGQNVGDGLFYSMWRNQALAATGGVFYLHNGCDVNSPIDAETRRFNDPLYGVRQNAEGFLFYLNGVAMIARSKDFNDKPEGFTAALREDSTTPFGAGWLRQFEVAAADAGLAGIDIQRKRSYNWGLLGDWTLSLRPPRLDSSVVAFEGPSYTSYAMQLDPGTYDTGDFAWRPDDIDSFAVPSSLELRMFHSGNSVGRYVTVRHDLPDVNHYFYDHYINSVEVRGRQSGAATLYSEANYLGAQASIPPGHYTFTQIRDSFGLYPKSVSSIRLDGVDIFIYDRQTWWNEWRAFGSSVANLTTYGWNDRLESIVVVPKGQYATAYQQQSWAGKHVVLEPGRYDTPDLEALGLNGWAISSISMGSGIRIRAYRQPGFQGPSLVLNGQSVSDLIPLGWNDSIVSIIVERR